MRRAFFGSVVLLTVATMAFSIAVRRVDFGDVGLLVWLGVVLGWLITVVLGVVWLIVQFARRS